jgi:hypothetical protein
MYVLMSIQVINGKSKTPQEQNLCLNLTLYFPLQIFTPACGE